MHVGIDTRSATPHFPGIGRYVTNLVPALKQHLGRSESVTTLQGAGGREIFPFPQVRVAGSPFSIRQQWEIPRRLTQLRADVYHSTYFLMPYRPHVPTVLTVYDLIPFHFPALSSLKARVLFTRFLRYAVGCADEIVAISECTRSDLHAHLGVPLSRITVTPLAAESWFRPQSTERIREVRTALGLDDPYVLCLASNRPHKNLMRLVEAWSIVRSRVPRSWKLVMAGTWDGRRTGLERRARELHLNDSVVFAGYIPSEALPALYTGAELFVFPSLYEGFGLPILEAMACGTPVACSNAGSLPEVGGPAAVYFDPLHVDDIAGTLTELIEDDTRRKSLADRCLRRAGAFSWEETARLTLEAYRRVARLS